MNIYQLFPRLFGNKNQHTKVFGMIDENGCGKLNDINEMAISSLKNLGISHIWLTGVLRHAKVTDYTKYGIPLSHPQTVKGRAGSPYAISDYFDIDPDLALNPKNRLKEFKQTVERIHSQDLGVIIDFVPNHLARQYKSVAKADQHKDFGETDNKNLGFSPQNNFYYLPDQKLTLPEKAGFPFEFERPYEEIPAKITGNDCFSATPAITDWYETVKLNYGTDFETHSQVTEPIPNTWTKMFEILDFWASQDVDGFRVDMAAMVPIPFWAWILPKMKAGYPKLIFIAEIYESALYQDFIDAGFDYLYDKVGLYNRLEDVLRHGHSAESVSICWKMLNGLDDKMLRFMENHDEVRLASDKFVGDAFKALPAVSLSALMHRGPFMIYNGQETGEEAKGSPGFSGNDGRSTLFDYDHLPAHQNWMNEGKFDGKKLSEKQKELRLFYKNILSLRLKSKAISAGNFYDLMWANPWHSNFDPRFVYAFLRYFEEEILLILVNFHGSESRNISLKIPEDAQKLAAILPLENDRCWIAENLFEGSDKQTFKPQKLHKEGLALHIEPSQTLIYNLQPIPANYDKSNYENC